MRGTQPECQTRARVRESAGRDAAAATLTLRWSISRPAAVALGLARERDDSVTLALSVVLHPGEGLSRTGQVAAVLHAGDRARELDIGPAGPGQCITDPETGLTHADIPGLLRCSFRMEEPGRVLLARTTLLEGLGLGGGRYEFLGGSLAP